MQEIASIGRDEAKADNEASEFKSCQTDLCLKCGQHLDQHDRGTVDFYCPVSAGGN